VIEHCQYRRIKLPDTGGGLCSWVDLKRACKRAGLPHTSPHRIGRHSFAARILGAGHSLKVLQEAGGWDSYSGHENEESSLSGRQPSQAVGGSKRILHGLNSHSTEQANVDLRAYVTRYGEDAIDGLVAIARDKKVPHGIRVAAYNSVLERGCGKPQWHRQRSWRQIRSS
jgi:Phage integrase family